MTIEKSLLTFILMPGIFWGGSFLPGFQPNTAAFLGVNVIKNHDGDGFTFSAKESIIGEAREIPGSEYFPPGTLDQLKTLTGLDAEQITNILGMINGPEQSNCNWWQTADGKIIYGYAENIDDGRGVTIGIYGATTGKGYEDADIIWKNYGYPMYRNLSQREIIEKVHAIANDKKWWKAQWDAYISTYWQPTMGLLNSKGYKSPLTIGALMDTAMNAGMDDDDEQHWGVKHLFEEANKGVSTEQDFLKKFLELRIQHPTENSGDMKKRINAWQKLLRDEQWDMRVDLNKYCYKP